MDRAFEIMLGEVHRYEGTVNQFLGDGLMALFGAPLAHEDHAERGVRAALAIRQALADHRAQFQREHGLDFQVRMGLNTGLVVVGKIGDNLRMDYTAVGDTTNLASRLVGLAEPGQILIGDATARAVEPYFLLDPLDAVAVKGKAQPVRATRVEGERPARSRLESVMERGLTPLVGRERELALLEDRLAEALERRGQVVFVFGEAGIGKSRLLMEFRRRVEAHRPTWLTGRCVSYGRGTPYVPVLDLLRGLFAIHEVDSVEVILDKVRVGLAGAGTDLAWTAPFVQTLLGLAAVDRSVAEMPPQQRRGRTVEALRGLVLRESERRPVVLVVEDLHWIDSHSEEALRILLEGIAAARVLLLLTHRPGYAPPFRDQTYHSRITLHGLPVAQAEAIVDGVLQGAGVPAAVREAVARRGEGNPLFIEEMARTLVEDGTLERAGRGYRLARPLDAAAIPSTIQGIIMARIDRLPEDCKAALQVASVIGREFSARLVERMSGNEQGAAAALSELRAVELIYQKAVFPELAYMFKHALIHDVAYDSLLRQRRRILHRKAGEVIEKLYADRLSEFYETLAWHFMQSEEWNAALKYLLRAAEKARAHYAYGRAIEHCTRALEIVGQHGGLAEIRVEASERLGDLYSLQGAVEPANRAYDGALAGSEDPRTRRRIENKRHRLGVVVRGGAKVAYYEHGGNEPTLVLMHPLFYGLGTYQPVLEALCQEFRVITVDPRGTGRSDPIPDGYRLRDHVEDAKAVIEATADRPVVLVGISRAGCLVINFAVSHPHLVDRLITLGTFPGESAATTSRAWVADVVRLVDAGSYEAAMRIVWELGVSEAGTRDLVEGLVDASSTFPGEVLRNFFLLEDPDRDVRRLLPGLRVPTLVLHGDEDRQVPLEAARYMADHIPGAQLYVFKGRGHYPHVTATAEFARVVRNFIRSGRPS
jgi:pimeloyl-ACP methyl ester carboxylesterase